MKDILLRTATWGLLLFFPVTPVTAEASNQPLLWGVALDGNPLTRERLVEVERQDGHPLQMVLFFLQWPSSPSEDNFPAASLEAIQQRGAAACITWEPMYLKDGKAVAVEWQRIMAGDYDPYLTAFAHQARQWGRPLIIRFAHEMNLAHYHWGTSAQDYGRQSPVIYQKIYRYVVEVFKKEGADNVLWAFAPNIDSVPAPEGDKKNSWNLAGNYYPGHDYVDILGMDGYNWGTSQTKEKHGWQSKWQGFAELFGPLYKELQALAPDKPIMVFETSSSTAGGDKGRWLADALTTARDWRLAGLIWFEVDKEVDWRLASGISQEDLVPIRTYSSPGQYWLGRLMESRRR